MRLNCSNRLLFLVLIVSIVAAGCGGGSDAVSLNSGKVADAGADQRVMAGDLVTLDGSASTGSSAVSQISSGGRLLTYKWSFVSKPYGSRASLSDGTAVDPTFTADKYGKYVLSLVVNDGTESAAEDTVTITAGEFVTQSSTHVTFFSDGTVETSSTANYRREGNHVVIEIYDNSDGVVDEIQSYDMDVFGDPITLQIDNNADGIVDETRTWNTYTYDNNGNIIKVELDWNNDGVVDTRSFYDSNGLRTIYEADNDGDGVVDRRTYYNEEGYEILYESDVDGDGIIENRDYYTYDAAGRRTSRESDWDGDGLIDSGTYYTFDSDGRITSSKYDQDGDGTVDELTLYLYTFDDNGNLIRVEEDKSGDGVIDRLTIITHDANGSVAWSDGDGIGSTETQTVCKTDIVGGIAKKTCEYDWGVDGIIDRIDATTYNADGAMIMEEHDRNGNGAMERRYGYDDYGNLIMREVDEDDNGVPDYRRTWTLTVRW